MYTHTQQALMRMHIHAAKSQGNKGLEVGSMIIGMGLFFFLGRLNRFFLEVGSVIIGM
jgi:hypothetical protein